MGLFFVEMSIQNCHYNSCIYSMENTEPSKDGKGVSKLDGVYSERYPADYGGHLASSGLYKNGHRVGLWTEFHTDGSNKKQCTYNSEGRLDGVLRTWYSVAEGGGPRSISHWYNNTLEGMCESYDPLAIGGEVIYSAVYADGKLHGPVLYFNGIDTIVENYNNGVLTTRITYQTPERLVINPTRRNNLYISDDSDSDSSDDGCLLTRTKTSDDCFDSILRSSSSTDISAVGSSPREPSPRDAASIESSPRDATSPRDSFSPRKCVVERVKTADASADSIELLHNRVAALRGTD